MTLKGSVANHRTVVTSRPLHPSPMLSSSAILLSKLLSVLPWLGFPTTMAGDHHWSSSRADFERNDDSTNTMQKIGELESSTLVEDLESCDESSTTSSEVDPQDWSDGDEKTNPFVKCVSTATKLQFRKHVSKARWDERVCMAELTEKRGGMWATTGIIQSGKLYLFVEETLFLAKIGALLVSDLDGNPLTVLQIAQKLAVPKNGCCFKSFIVFKRLKSLGYIIGCHNIPWTMKNYHTSTSQILKESDNGVAWTINSCGNSSSQFTPEGNSGPESNQEGEENVSITHLFRDLRINGMKPSFDVYSLNNKFRKSSPGDPCFMLCLLGETPPSKTDFETFERESKGVPLKYCHVGCNARITFFSCSRVELPTLP